jgi:[acyl-carrier-protein] S-malonyltransferase
VSADVCAGHSVGEIAALVGAGVLKVEDGLRIVQARGRAMQEAGTARPGTMAAILGLDADEVRDLCDTVRGGDVLSAANFNCPGQVVVSGSPEAVGRAVAEATSRGAKRAVELAVSGAFHSDLMSPAVESLGAVLEKVRFSPPRVPVIPNVSADPSQDEEELRRLLLKQIVSPVRWDESMSRLVSDGLEEALEVGPGTTLKGLMRRIDKDTAVRGAGTWEEIQGIIA